MVSNSTLNFNNHEKTGFAYNTSGDCGVNEYGYFGLGEIFELPPVLLESTGSGDGNGIEEFMNGWGNDPYHFSKARVHLKTNALLHYYVSFPILQYFAGSSTRDESIYVDAGYYVLAQLNAKDGLYDPLKKTFNIDYNTDWKRNKDFEDAINDLIQFSLVRTPTVKDFEANFVIISKH